MSTFSWWLQQEKCVILENIFKSLVAYISTEHISRNAMRKIFTDKLDLNFRAFVLDILSPEIIAGNEEKSKQRFKA